MLTVTLQVNDLPLDQYCRDLQCELDVLTAIPRADRSWDFDSGKYGGNWALQKNNVAMFPARKSTHPLIRLSSSINGTRLLFCSFTKHSRASMYEIR